MRKIDEKQKKMAQLLYVFAVLYARKGMKHVAKGYGEECVELLKKLKLETMKDCATSTISIRGVFIPELFHEEVVRRNLKHYGIEL